MNIKTIMVFGLLSATMAISANAANVTWQTGNLNGRLPVSAGEAFADQWSGGSAYYFIVGASFDRDAFITNMQADYIDGETSKGIAGWNAFASGADGEQTIARVGATWSANVSSGKNGGIGVSSAFYAIAVFVDNNGAFAVSDLISATTPAVLPGTYTPPITYLNTTQVYEFGGLVPEPTSMALLALGAAVLGLRRRFRG